MSETKIDQLKMVEKEINILSDQLSNKRGELFNLQMKTIAEFFGTGLLTDTEIGFHECQDSPIGICFYNVIEDPALDNCLICGDPEERK